MERFRLRDYSVDELEREAQWLVRLVRDAVDETAEVMEVGSTAVAGVIGKGDLDILVRCPAERFPRIRAMLDEAFERDQVQLSNEQYQGYRVESDWDAAIQLTVTNGPYDRFTQFLEALRADPDLVARYNVLKRSYDGEPMAVYRRAKSDFIEGVLRQLI